MATFTLSQDNSHNLVPGYDGKVGRTGAACNLVQLSVADSANGNPDQHLFLTGAGYRYPIRNERWIASTQRGCPVQSHGAHLAGNVLGQFVYARLIHVRPYQFNNCIGCPLQ
jgi:hypothetical protein